jgi:hypothetical protein
VNCLGLLLRNEIAIALRCAKKSKNKNTKGQRRKRRGGEDIYIIP